MSTACRLPVQCLSPASARSDSAALPRPPCQPAGLWRSAWLASWPSLVAAPPRPPTWSGLQGSIVAGMGDQQERPPPRPQKLARPAHTQRTPVTITSADLWPRRRARPGRGPLLPWAPASAASVWERGGSARRAAVDAAGTCLGGVPCPLHTRKASSRGLHSNTCPPWLSWPDWTWPASADRASAQPSAQTAAPRCRLPPLPLLLRRRRVRAGGRCLPTQGRSGRGRQRARVQRPSCLQQGAVTRGKEGVARVSRRLARHLMFPAHLCMQLRRRRQSHPCKHCTSVYPRHAMQASPLLHSRRSSIHQQACPLLLPRAPHLPWPCRRAGGAPLLRGRPSRPASAPPLSGCRPGKHRLEGKRKCDRQRRPQQ